MGTSGVGIPLVRGMINRSMKQTPVMTANTSNATCLFVLYKLEDLAPKNEPEPNETPSGRLLSVTGKTTNSTRVFELS